MQKRHKILETLSASPALTAGPQPHSHSRGTGAFPFKGGAQEDTSRGWGCDSMLEHMLSMRGARDPIPGTIKKRKMTSRIQVAKVEKGGFIPLHRLRVEN